jgi:PAS domain S-box-containing protein
VSAADLLGRNDYEVAPEISDDFKAIHRRALEGEIVRSEETAFPKEDGSEEWLKWECRPWRHADGTIGGIIIFTEDITRWKHSEAALRESETRFRQIAESIREVFWLTDPEKSEILYLSPAYETVWGRTVSDCYASPQSWMESIHPDDRERVRIAAVNDQVRGTYDIEYRVVRPDGSVRWVRDRAFPVQDGQGRVRRIAGVAEDITVLRKSQQDRLRADRELLDLNVSLEARIAERTTMLEDANRDLEAFSYSVSHDLRAPLRAIDGFLSIISDEGSLNEVQREATDRALSKVSRMNQLIGDLMSLARVDRHPLMRRPVDMAEIANEVIDGLRERDPDRVVAWQVDAAEAHADPELIRIVLENLLGNAWKFTSRKSAACIRFRTEMDVGGTPVHVVEDDGAGFDPARAVRLFQPFQRLHASKDFEGTGIGLATVERIIRRHGGRIWAESKPGEGARFRFTLGSVA